MVTVDKGKMRKNLTKHKFTIKAQSVHAPGGTRRTHYKHLFLFLQTLSLLYIKSLLGAIRGLLFLLVQSCYPQKRMDVEVCSVK